MEKPFHMGQTIVGESVISKTPLVFIPVLDITSEIELVSNLKFCVHENEVTQKLKELGLER